MGGDERGTGVALDNCLAWRGRDIRWGSMGSGPPVVFCHGTPWSSYLWGSCAEALSAHFTCYLWDMPGYGQSSMDSDHDVSLEVQGEALTGLVGHWGLKGPHLVCHDYGGAVALRAHLLHGMPAASFALVDVVALAPWGSDFFRLVREHSHVFAELPDPLHRALVAEYISGASRNGLSGGEVEALTAPWITPEGKQAFYRQIAAADQRFTDEIEPLYSKITAPVQIVWGRDDSWIPVEQGRRLKEMIPGARLMEIDDAGHLIQLDQPARVAVNLYHWLATRSSE